ncbi:MAG: NAD(P)H-dependent glycerol-3-phosphate dehydrogenase [Acetivibrionales bacterium]|jgi:glycerol-3-phosphate dehydrogenase (NAD(P)+)|nr:NAD(P)H-dependent glycerol-3-phosphate dehydrogenase [Clostridiaceae bacterium]HOA54246.1 NAD(P)H-dependent glycerol-3-phosphate dehydrogenase [Clostridiales bacterium]HPZ04985.1 NAD(P)H-dependent glycerol-3-phosphate dehydrogenase [Clostridiales bacterium]HQD30593.1 NAD(P)H-dependent glycerol-3-phosphate dehydrogenase [Clostridiales bacterium]
MGRNVSVLGAGSMGTAVSVLLADNGHNVMMWSIYRDEVDMINNLREQKDKLPGVVVPQSVSCTDDLEEAMQFSDICIIVIPAQKVRENMSAIASLKQKPSLISCFSKGLEKGSGLRMSEVINEELPGITVVAMSGPCHAEELSKGIPTAYVAASESRKAAEMIQDLFMSPRFRVYTNPDIVGVELGGAIKNIIALCAGISDGLGYGDNTKAALMTRGIAEISRLGCAMGAKRQTFSGLAGIGDLIVTCTSMHSRNRRAGILIGQGLTVEQTLEEVKMVVEGVYTTEPVYKLSRELGISMPITAEAHAILFEGKDPASAVSSLMSRNRTCEHEAEDLDDIWK